MKATVMTTGPGVIIATATASRNCWSLSQPYCSPRPVEKRHDRQPAAEDERAGLGEEQKNLPEPPIVLALGAGEHATSGAAAKRTGAMRWRRRRGRRFHQPNQYAGRQESATASDSVTMVTAAQQRCPTAIC